MAEESSNVSDYVAARARRGLSAPVERGAAPIDGGGDGPHDPGMDDGWRAKVDDRLMGVEKGLLEIKGDISGLKIAIAALGSSAAIVAAVLGGLTYSTMGKVDVLGSRMTEEFRVLRTEMSADARALRAEMSAQTSAIANSITATKQQAPQVILVPAPQVVPSPPQPAPETPTEPPPKQ